MSDRSCVRLHALCAELRRLQAEADVRRADAYLMHGGTSCLIHMIAVAYVSMTLLEGLHLRYRRRELLRGALLHDLFLYDWHDPNHPKADRRHAFSHPDIALANARERVRLTELETDIIAHHMFPVTLTPPGSREALAVCLADKLCALYEALRPDCYRNLRRICSPVLNGAGKAGDPH